MEPAAAAQASETFCPHDRWARLRPSYPLSGGILRGLALAAGVSIATALIFNPAIAQQSLDGGTATGASAYASGNGATATGIFATATGTAQPRRAH